MKDILNIGIQDFTKFVSKATNLGYYDELNFIKVKTGEEIIQALEISRFRNGHKSGLKSAYSLGRFHAKTQI